MAEKKKAGLRLFKQFAARRPLGNGVGTLHFQSPVTTHFVFLGSQPHVNDDLLTFRLAILPLTSIGTEAAS